MNMSALPALLETHGLHAVNAQAQAPAAGTQSDAVCSSCAARLSAGGEHKDVPQSHRLTKMGSGALRQQQEEALWRRFNWEEEGGDFALGTTLHISAMLCLVLAVLWLTWQPLL